MRAVSAASTPRSSPISKGTPFYAYDLDVVGGQVEALRRRLPSSVDLAYAVKANPSPRRPPPARRARPGRRRGVRRWTPPGPAGRVRGR